MSLVPGRSLRAPKAALQPDPLRCSGTLRPAMAQNIYDDPTFFEGYSRLDRSTQGLSGAAEWPTMRTLLPDLTGRRIVDLGCGFGWFCRYAREQGAAHVLGIDVSERMLARAAELTTDREIEYRRSDLEHLSLPERSFELAFSSLALHYVADVRRLLATVARALTPGGHLVWSVEHPIFTAPSHPGWAVGSGGGNTWPVDRYFAEGPRETHWLAEGVIKQHRTLATYLNALTGAGFRIARVEEFGPTEEQVAVHPDWAVERERPMFLLMQAVRGASVDLGR